MRQHLRQHPLRLAAATVVVFSASAVSAATLTVYTSRPAFEAALTGTKTVEPFNVSGRTDLQHGSNVRNGVNYRISHAFTSTNTALISTGGRSRFQNDYGGELLGVLSNKYDTTTTQNLVDNVDYTLTVALPGQASGFGGDFYYSDYGNTQFPTPGVSLTIAGTTKAVPLPTRISSDMFFFGLISDTPFSEVAFSKTDLTRTIYERFELDNMTFDTLPLGAPVPIPEPLAVLGGGTLLGILAQRRRGPSPA